MSKKYLRKTLSLVLALTLILPLLSMLGASAQDVPLTYGPSREEYLRDADGHPQFNGLKLTVWLPMRSLFRGHIESYYELNIFKDIDRMMGITFDWIHPAAGQERENFALMIAGDTLPDLIMGNGIDSYYPGGITKAYDDGMLFDYSELINEQYTPNFIEKVLNVPFYRKGAFDDTGRVIRLGSGISGSEENCATMFGFMMRGDMLAATGLEKPLTIDEWYEVLTTMKKNGVEYPLLLDRSNYWQSRNAFSAAYGLSAMDFCILEDGKTVTYGPYADAYKDYLTTMHKWYSEGLINPDFMNQDNTHTWSMMADNLGAVTPNHTYAYEANYYVPVELKEPERALIALDYPRLNKDDVIHNMVTTRNLINHRYITADTKYPLACVLLFDSLYMDDIEFLFSYGVVGSNAYHIDEHGYPVLTTQSADTPKSVFENFGIYEWETATDDDLQQMLLSKYCYGVQPECIRLMIQNMYDRNYPSFAFRTSVEADLESKYLPDVTTYRAEMVLKFVTGNEDLANFELYQQTLRDLHIEELIAGRQAAYDRYLARE